MSNLATALTAASAPDREGTDFYPTPADVTLALLGALGLPAGTHVWEPACGQGHISTVLTAAGLYVTSTDLYDRGFGAGGQDFLTTDLPEGAEWVITNPPFGVSEAFIRRCLSLGLPFALLLKGQYWHSKRRRELFEAHRPSHVLPLTWRPDFLMGRKGGSPTMEAAWTIWQPEPAQFTVYSPLVRPALAQAQAGAGSEGQGEGA